MVQVWYLFPFDLRKIHKDDPSFLLNIRDFTWGCLCPNHGKFPLRTWWTGVTEAEVFKTRPFEDRDLPQNRFKLAQPPPFPLVRRSEVMTGGHNSGQWDSPHDSQPVQTKNVHFCVTSHSLSLLVFFTRNISITIVFSVCSPCSPVSRVGCQMSPRGESNITWAGCGRSAQGLRIIKMTQDSDHGSGALRLKR